MEHYGLRQFTRTILTVIGIVLLIVFGTRAASQASSLTAVGGSPKPSILPVVLPGQQFAVVGADAQAADYAVSYQLSGFTENTAAAPSNGTSAARKAVQTVKAAAAEAESAVETTAGNLQAAGAGTTPQGIAASRQH